MIERALILVLLLAGCGWKSPHEFEEKMAASDEDAANSNSDPATDASLPDMAPLADMFASDAGADAAAPDAGSDAPSAINFASLGSGSNTAAGSATTPDLQSDQPVLLWVFGLQSGGAAASPTAAGFQEVERNAMQGRQIVLLQAPSVSGPIDISFGAPQDVILWIAMSSSSDAIGQTGTYDGQNDSASIAVSGEGGVAAAFMARGTNLMPSTTLTNSGESPCAMGMCMFGFWSDAATADVALSWGQATPSMGIAATFD